MHKILILSFIFLLPIYPQSSDYLNNFISYDVVQFPDENNDYVILLYRIPYKTLVFEKDEELFKAAFRISAEIFDSAGFVTREIIESQIQTNSFSKTDSKDSTKEGFISFRLKNGSYKILSVLTDMKSKRELKLFPKDIKVDSSAVFYQPLVIAEENCLESNYKLSSFEGSFPFSSRQYGLIVPVRNKKDIKYFHILNNSKILKEGEIKVEDGSLLLVNCSGDVYIKTSISEMGYLMINPGTYLYEGDLEIRLLNNEKKLLYSHKKGVKWYNKPTTLRDRNTAIKLLGNIDSSESLEYLYNAEAEFDSLFYLYWKKYDPTPETIFNELLAEFYNRADYAADNFKSINGRSGLENDRGKIYIKFGRPMDVSRSSNEKGKIIEIWIYNDKKFTFIDEKGTGEFNLLNS